MRTTELKPAILVGCFPETIELCGLCGYTIIGIIEAGDRNHQEYPILGDDSDAAAVHEKYPDVPAIIGADKPAVRQKLVSLYQGLGFAFASLVSPKAFISPSAAMGRGCVVQSFCNVSADTVLGDFVKVNTYANIMHDCKLDDYVTVAPNAVILGHVKIGRCSYIGANATIIQTNTVGRNSVIGAGAVVTGHVGDNTTVAGSPARKIR